MGTYYCLRSLAGDFRTIRRGIYRIKHAIRFRSLEDNVCIISAINLEKIKDLTNMKIDEIIFAGRKSKGALLCQILVYVTGCKIKVPKVTKSTALGASMVAGVEVGIYEKVFLKQPKS